MQNDQQYIDRILNSGSEAAVFALVKKYETQVFNLCFRILRNREVAEEVAQDVFLKAFKELIKLQDRDKFGAWLMRIAYTKAIDEVRKKKLDSVSLQGIEQREDDFFETPLSGLESKGRLEAIEMLMEQLSKIENALISLYYLDGYTIKEVAQITGLSESNVKIKLMRTRDFLKKQLVRNFGEEAQDLY